MECIYYTVLCFYHICVTAVKCGDILTPQTFMTILQKRVIRLVFAVKRLEHTSTLFQQLGVLKCVDLVKLKTAIIMFRDFHNELPSNLRTQKFKPYLYVYSARQND